MYVGGYGTIGPAKWEGPSDRRVFSGSRAVGYVEVNEDVENETMTYLEEVWTEGQRNEMNRVNVIPRV